MSGPSSSQPSDRLLSQENDPMREFANRVFAGADFFSICNFLEITPQQLAEAVGRTDCYRRLTFDRNLTPARVQHTLELAERYEELNR